jgi:hypothetical protein
MAVFNMTAARAILAIVIGGGLAGGSYAQGPKTTWREATESELREVIPARAPVEKERIETEFRTATGITDGKGRFVAAVLLITAGYSADGKYSHFLAAQVPIKVAGIHLKPGEYAIGWRRNDESLSVRFYDAENGSLLGTAEAQRINRIGRIESFRIFAPSEKPLIQIGRFGLSYELER